MGGDDGEEVEVELLHCDHVGPDRPLGSTVVNVSDILKHAPARGQAGPRAVERTFPVPGLTRDGEPITHLIAQGSVLRIDAPRPKPAGDNQPVAQAKLE